jgi:sugar transferase (PEP-CTERM/EpsH1 system associated)
MTLHVVHVLHSLGVGGTEHGVVNLVTALRDGFRHTVVAMTATGPLAARLPADVAVHCLAKRPGLDVRAVGRLARLLRRLAPDVVHSRNWAAFDAVPAARLAGVPVVIHGEHGREITDPHGLNARRRRLRRAFAPLVTHFVTVSIELERWLVETVGVPARKVSRIPNGVDSRRFAVPRGEAARRALGVPGDALVVGTVGRLDPVKDQLTLLEAFARAGAAAGGRVLVIVGDGPCRAALAERAGRADLAGLVVLAGQREDVPLLLSGLDVFVLPSIMEGMCNTILEAMAAGLPVVATRTGGNPELVEHGVTGTLVPVGSVPPLAAAIDAYLADPHLRELHGKAGRQRVEERFSLERMSDAYRALYERLGGRGRRS